MNVHVKKTKVTVLTDPMPWGKEFLMEGARRIARGVRDKITVNKKNYNRSQYRGHFAVTRSLIEGLKGINAHFNYNPLRYSQLADTVIVLAGVRTLRQAIRLKQAGRIKRLFAGPNIVVFSSDHDSILAAPEIDHIITPCEWVINVYAEDHPLLSSRSFAWPAGVDTTYWQPSPRAKRGRILIFEKQNKGPVPALEPYVQHMREGGWEVDVIKYGSFTHVQYREMLQESCLMIGFVVCESQGIAWAEAWSMDVPTLIWKRTKNTYCEREYKNSTAPYLCIENGLFFDDFEDFKLKFAYWASHQEQFSPRDWVLENMSDEVCASVLYQKVTEFQGMNEC